jgi:TolB-like protein
MGNASVQTSAIRFATFAVDPQSGELRKAGARVKLQEQPLQMLLLLLERPGEVVTREALRKRLWPDGTFVDFEHSLATALKKIRRALGDSAAHPQFIETLPRRGYRFIAALEAGTGEPKTILAILPFENLSGDAGQEYLADGMTEELIARLGRLHPQRLGVIARASTVRYKKSTKDVDQIGAELGAAYVLKGALGRSGRRLRASAELIQVKDRTHLWADRWECDATQLQEIQARLARGIAHSLQVSPPPARRSATTGTTTASPAAHSAFLRGRYALNKGTAEGVRNAIEHFVAATSADSGFAVAQAGLAVALNLADHFRVLPGSHAFPRAKAAALRALQINESLAEAHNALAFARHSFDWNWLEAERAYQRAIALNPNFSTARHWHGFYLGMLGRLEEALAEMRRAQQLNPLSMIIRTHLGLMLYRAGKYDEAVEQLRQTLDMEPDFAAAHYFLSWAYQQKGMYQETIAHLEKALAVSPASPDKIGALGHAHAYFKRKEPARYALEQLRRLAPRRFVSAYDFAIVYVGLGEKEQALDWLDKACEERSFSMLMSLKAEPRLDALRSHRRFHNLVRRVGLEP